MTTHSGPSHREDARDAAIRLLEQELADTNREVLALTLELDERIEQLRAAEERYRRLAENAPDVILRYDLNPQRFCTFVNPRVTAITGRAPDEYYANPDLLYQTIHPEDRPVWDALISGAGSDVGTFTVRWLHKAGIVAWVELHHVRVRGARGELAAIECIARDVTGRKKLEEQYLQAQKMEAIGRLAGGVAHDFNNLLTVINGYSAEALEELPAAHPLRDSIEEIYKAGERAASLTRQLLAFSRRQVLTPRVLDLNAVVTDLERMLQRVVGEDIELKTVLASDLESVMADAGQVEQVIMNLVVNARDAMPDGGKLLIETANTALDDSWNDTHLSVRPGRYAMLAVSDTGCGMDQQTLQHIFEPFFTTKPQGQGTGLGLATVFGIVEQSGGSVTAYSEVGVGTTFKVYLPSVTAAAAETVKQPAATPVLGTETILVVEDEDGVRRLMGKALRKAGYTLLEACTPAEALLLNERHGDAIDLLITDVVLPQMNGRELAARLSAGRPDLKVLFISGYTANALAQHGPFDAQIPFLQKPFTALDLALRVRETLDSKLRR